MAGCKVKVGGLSAEADAARVAACRDGVGPDWIIAVDANRGWPVAEAVKFARLIERHDIRWFEEPCHWYDDAAGMAEVRQRTTIPINAGQSEISSHGVRRLIAAGAVDIVNFDASEAGGVTEWRRAAGMCAVHGIEMAHHEEPQIAVHMLAAVPHGTYVECFPDPERDPLWAAFIKNRTADQGRHHRGAQGPRLRSRPRLGHGREIPPRSVIPGCYSRRREGARRPPRGSAEWAALFHATAGSFGRSRGLDIALPYIHIFAEFVNELIAEGISSCVEGIPCLAAKISLRRHKNSLRLRKKFSAPRHQAGTKTQGKQGITGYFTVAERENSLLAGNSARARGST